MLGNNALKAVNAVKSLACTTAKRFEKFDSMGVMLRPQSTLMSLIASGFNQPQQHHFPLPSQQQLSNVSSISKYSCISSSSSNSTSYIAASNQILLFQQRFDDDTYQRSSIPLPFVHVVDNDAIRKTAAVEMRPLKFTNTTLNDNILHGINHNCYFLSMNGRFGSTADHQQHGLFCYNDDPKEQRTDTHQQTTTTTEQYDCMNRNARRGKRANKGKRACSRQNRRKRRRRFGNHKR